MAEREVAEANMKPDLLNRWFPYVFSPFIANAPMFGTADATLASAVSKAGGFGKLLCSLSFPARVFYLL